MSADVLPMINARQERLGLPILSGALPLFGHQAELVYRPLALVQRARALGSPLVWIDAGFGNWALDCYDPASYELLRDKSVSIRHYGQVAPILLGQSLLTQDGEPHRSARNAMNGPFTPKGLSAQGTSAIMKEVVEREVGVTLDEAAPLMLIRARTLALDIIFRILGIDPGELDAWRDHYEDVMLSIIPIPWMIPGFPAWRAARARRWLTERLQKRIAVIRQDSAATGLLAEMVRGWDSQEKPGGDLPLIDNVLLLALAGHETTASTMTWMACHLAADPGLWARVVAEARAVGAVPQSPADLARFPLIEGLFRECLRLYPPVPAVTRLITEPVELCGVTLPPGVQISFPILAWYRDPALHAEPDSFRPERWIGRERRPSPLETIAFSYGPHFCLGYHVAWTEAVQFGVALALQASARGVRPALAGPMPKPSFKGLCTPKKAQTRLRWVQA